MYRTITVFNYKIKKKCKANFFLCFQECLFTMTSPRMYVPKFRTPKSTGSTLVLPQYQSCYSYVDVVYFYTVNVVRTAQIQSETTLTIIRSKKKHPKVVYNTQCRVSLNVVNAKRNKTFIISSFDYLYLSN